MRFRNASGQRIRLDSGARMNDDNCCCDVIWCDDEFAPISTELVAVISGVVAGGEGIDCDEGGDGCGHVYNRTLTAGGATLITAGCVATGTVTGSCGKKWTWTPDDLGSCSFSLRGALFRVSLLATGDYLLEFVLGRSGVSPRVSWSINNGPTNPTLPVTFGPSDFDGECNGGELCDFSGASISVAIA